MKDKTATILYNLREKYEFCSGNDLHSFFHSAVGEPSPSGCVELDGVRALEFVENCCDAMSFNSPSLAGHCERTKRVAKIELMSNMSEVVF